MVLDLLRVTGPSFGYIIIGGFAVLVYPTLEAFSSLTYFPPASYDQFTIISRAVKDTLYVNEVVLGTIFGIIMGPYCANVFDPRSWGASSESNIITLEVLRVVLAVGLFIIGVQLPPAYLAKHVRGLLVMVVPTMAFGWVAVAGIIHAVFPSMDFVSSLAISACLTPTDPIICSAIVGVLISRVVKNESDTHSVHVGGKFAEKHVPRELQWVLSAESAANDGLAYPFLSLSLYLVIEASTRSAIGKWLLVGCLYQVIMGAVLGAVLGATFCEVMKLLHKKGLLDEESYLSQYVALAIFTIGLVSTLGSDDLLAAFAAGSAIGWNGHFQKQTGDGVFPSVIDLLLNCACFVYIGAWLPFNAFNTPGLGILPWRLIVVLVSVLTIRRIPPLLLLYKWVPEISGWQEALLAGYFGPMGVSALFVSTMATTWLPTPQNPPQDRQEYLAATIQTIVAFVVLGSIIIHGLSISFFSFWRIVHARIVAPPHVKSGDSARSRKLAPSQTISSIADSRWTAETMVEPRNNPDGDLEAGQKLGQLEDIVVIPTGDYRNGDATFGR